MDKWLKHKAGRNAMDESHNDRVLCKNSISDDAKVTSMKVIMQGELKV
jgi:hypothetical protein